MNHTFSRRAFLLCGGAMLCACGGDGGATPPLTGTVPPVSPPPPPPPPPLPPPPPSQAWPSGSDPLITILSSMWTYRGNHVPGATYVRGDVVEADGKTWFCFAAAVTVDRPADDRLHFRELALLQSAENVLIDDRFSERPGNVAGRPAGGGYSWHASGIGGLLARVENGFMSSSGNTYFEIGGFTEPVSSWSVWCSNTSPEAMFTTAVSARHLSGLFQDMYHINWTSTGVGFAGLWDSRIPGGVNLTPNFLYAWPSADGGNYAIRLEARRSYKLTLHSRGAFLFGLVDDVLAFVHLCDDLPVLGSPIRSLYFQNYSDLFGAQRFSRVVINRA